ncbi:MAG: type I glyceraldehyde-3-phosphate dehydrogenase [Candidatus Peribacteraceae bacterium]|nr:type I glyceraldehyde-3-phosphate dehydrogenase [Candidatus Peribacteraceae bacterium]
MNIAINGFGRIGRQALHLILENHPDMNVVLINDPGDGATLAHLLEFDSNYGHYDCGATFKDGTLTVKGKKITVTQTKDPATLPHKELKVDIVLECTGKFCKREDAALHLKAGAKKVILSAPGKDEIDGTFVLGVNEGTYDPKKMSILSNASCTTNSLAPVAKVLDESFGIAFGLMTTIHSYTNDQVILDVAHKDLRRARAAALNMIPTSTGAAKAIGLVLPNLKGKMSGISVRVPTPTVSITDLTVTLKKKTTAEEINAAFEKAAAGPMKGILGVEKRALVSMDFKKDSRSSIVDAPSTQVIDDGSASLTTGTLAKVLAWYDNEWGYSCRLVELAEFVGKRL